MTRLSVIVPVYNVASYLDECLSSLEAQDCHDFEAVCVDDGSTDASADILAAWYRTHEWVRVVSKANGGLSSARNAGLAVAQGDYVCFLDSDDRYVPNACSKIIESLDQSGADALVFGGFALPRDASTPWMDKTLSPTPATYEGLCEELLFRPDTRPFVWRNAFCRDFLLREGLSFNEDIAYGEDQVFQFAAYARSRKTEVIPDRLYEYRVTRSGSLMSDVRRSACSMLLEHVNIVRIVLDDYAALGIVDSYARPFLSWVCSFIVDDALSLPHEECARVLDALGEVLRSHWDEDDVMACGLSSPEANALSVVMAHANLTRLSQLRLSAALHKELYGRLSTLRMILGRDRGLV